MINNRFNVVYHLLGFVINLFYLCKKYKNMKIGKKYQTGLSESHRPDLQPNGKVVRCVEDKGNGYLVVTFEDEKEPNTWLVNEKHLTEIKTN